MDKFDFCSMVSDILSECKTIEQMDLRIIELKQIIENMGNMSKKYLKAGIL